MVKKKRTFRIFGFLGTVAIVLALAGTGGVFFFESVSQGQLDVAKKALDDADARLGGTRESKILAVKTYDDQLQYAEKLLSNHLSPSRLFTALEQNTSETIQYKSFEYEYDPGFEAFLTLGGATKEFTSVVAQETRLDSADSPYGVVLIEDITKIQSVSEEEEVALYDEGEVSFNVTGILKENRFVYTGEESVPEPVVETESIPDSIPESITEEESNPDNQ
jgi:hypothetical protein